MRLDELTTVSAMIALSGCIAVTACGDSDDVSGDGTGAFVRTDLVSNVDGLARTTDPNLDDPWGIAAGKDTFLWVVNRGSGTATVYDGEGETVFFEQVDGDDVAGRMQVDIPAAPGAAPGGTAPLSIVHNSLRGFEVEVSPGDADPAEFLFGTELGAIAGWADDLGFEAGLLLSSADNAAYTSLEVASLLLRFDRRLYAVDFRNGVVETYEEDLDRDFDVPSDAFIDPSLRADLVPFAIAEVDGEIFVTYARPRDSGVVPEHGPGLGAISVFDRDGEWDRTLAVGEPLNAPSAIVELPGSFDPLGGDSILVANSGDGRILAYDEDSGAFLGTLSDDQGVPIVIEGLRGLEIGNGDQAGTEDQVFFTASRDGESLLGRIERLRR